MRLILTLFVLLCTQLYLNLAHASPQVRVSVEQKKAKANQASPELRKKRKIHKKTKKIKIIANKTATNKLAANNDKKKIARSKKTKKAVYGRQRNKISSKASTELFVNDKIKLSPIHKKRYQQAKQTAMNKLMKQVGKPYRWGGSSPNTGFDCSGLIYYAYKDVIRIKMPRTANEMYHLRDAAPVKLRELESGDLVFFNIANRGVADHVGVYLGNGKFIQSPRTGEEIRISMLDNDYWQNHYVGARRVMTPKNMR